MIPATDSLAEIQASIRDLQSKLNRLTQGNVDMNKRRVVNAAPSVGAFDYVTNFEIRDLRQVVKQSKIAIGVATSTGNPKTIIDDGGVFVYDSNGTLVHALSITTLT